MSKNKKEKVEGFEVKPRVRLLDDIVVQIGEARKAGNSASEIALRMNLPVTSVRNVLLTLVKHGVKFPKASRSYNSRYDKIAKGLM